MRDGVDSGGERREEFERVALPHLDALYGFARKLTGNGADAEDLVQETYLRAYRFFDTFRPGTQIRAWLHRILRNTHINRYRAARARPDEVDLGKIESAYERAVDETFLQTNAPASPEEIVMRGVVDDEIREAMALLPDEYRDVVLLVLVRGLPYREAAEILDVPIGTVMSRLHRGRKILQGALLEYAARRGIAKRAGAVDGYGGKGT